VFASLAIGVYLLFFPALRLLKTKKRPQAMALFTRASYYPLALLALVVTNIIVKSG
jgi:4-hydroxybenzoate polyprenyltransferase